MDTNTLANTKFGKNMALVGWFVAVPILVIMFFCNGGSNSIQKQHTEYTRTVYIQNGRIVKSFPACVSQAKFDELSDLSARNDNYGVEYLLKRGVCSEMLRGSKVSVIDRHKFRLYKNDGTYIDLYTASDFLITQ